jgi:hypothetical protein
MARWTDANLTTIGKLEGDELRSSLASVGCYRIVNVIICE